MLFSGKATDALDARPSCDICKQAIVPQTTPAIADGKTTQGPWGYLCARHFDQMGVGLGEGRGQVLICGDELDFDLLQRFRLIALNGRGRTARERKVIVEAQERRT